MASRIEDYALIGDTQTAALVAKDGSIDWLCLPRFDSGACFAALLGSPQHGRWLLAPVNEAPIIRRHYRGHTLVLETEYKTVDGTIAVIDFMPPRSREADVVRIVEGRRGRVSMRMELIFRFDYGAIVPWVRRLDRVLKAVGGPDAILLRTEIQTRGEHFTTVGNFTVSEGQRIPFVLTWHPSHEPDPLAIDPEQALNATEAWWKEWSNRCTTMDSGVKRWSVR